MQETKERQIKINNKGITLVALVITVIVLLILASVGIGAIVGEDGLITKAQEAAELYEQVAREEANAINAIFEMVNGGTSGGESEEPEQPVIDATNTNVQFIYTPSTPTKGSVTVEITTTTGYMIQYRKGETGNYSRYTGAFTVEENTAIYAKLANSSGVTGGYITGNVQNIDKIAPNEFTPTIGTITTNSIVVNARTEDTGSIGCAAVNTGIKEYRYYANGVLQHTGLEESVTITGLTAGTEYSIYVIAEDKAGNTTTSNAVTAETKENTYTVTLLASSQGFTEGASSGGGREGGVWYAINGESTLAKVKSVPTTLTNVKSIRFHVATGLWSRGEIYATVSYSYDFNQTHLVRASGSGDSADSSDISITKNTTFYLSDYGTGLPEISIN